MSVATARQLSDLQAQLRDLGALFWSLQGNAMHKDQDWEARNEQLVDLGIRHASAAERLAVGIEERLNRDASDPQLYPFDGTGAPIPEAMRRIEHVSFPACILEAEKIHRRSSRHGLEFAGEVLRRQGGMTYMEAEAICAMLRIGGHKDWRVPSLDEMQRLHRIARCEGLYWTSTPADSDAFTTTIEFESDALVEPLPKAGGCFLLPVRSMAPGLA